MDKFVKIPSSGSSSASRSAGTACDLLSMMKNTNQASVSAASWAEREQQLNSTSLSCNEKNKKMNTDIIGWRIIDGAKTYTTFRNGKIVRATGFAGFQLAAADNPKHDQNEPKGKENTESSVRKRKESGAQEVAQSVAGKKAKVGTIEACFNVQKGQK
jgi:hypothetical protein